MRIFKTVAGLRSYLEQSRQEQKTIGFVPTMGALHGGHVSLIEQAKAENDVVTVSIFVNPLQFSLTEDLQLYPRTLEADCLLCEQLGVNVVFAPSSQEMGIADGSSGDSPTTTTVMPPQEMISVLCGQFRKGHFQGVATVVTKLLNVVQPTRAYFGEKDAQQLAILRRLVADLFIPVEIKGCPIIREKSGLALSSRNAYLTPEQAEKAVLLSRSLRKAQEAFAGGIYKSTELMAVVQEELAKESAIRVEYVEVVNSKTLQPIETIEGTGLLAIATYLDSTRLIDNIMLRRRQPIIAIDGPAGAGKSTVTRRVASALGLLYLDTGAMYRAMTWLVLDSGIAINDESAVAELVSEARLQLIPTSALHAGTQVLINDQDVTEVIRTASVTANVSAISAQPAVRQVLVKQQQQWGEKGGIVAEGRDIGTRVFPNAEVKIFLTASVSERARRRWQELQAKGDKITIEQLERDIQRRDHLDSTRKASPLIQAVDAVEIVTDGLTIEEVTAEIIKLYSSVVS